MARAPQLPGIPPLLELQCLDVLWDLESGTVHAVRNQLLESKPLAYTTVMTVLDRLVKRGIVTRKRQGRSYVYTPRVTRDAMRHTAIQGFVNAFFDGSEEALLNWLRNRAADSELIVEQQVAEPAESSWPEATEEDEASDFPA